MSYLKKLPIDTLKIDKSFIDTVLTDSATRVITESIINMVKSLGFDSIAEGVENEKQYKYLHSIGCDVIQGYLFNKPLPAEEMEPAGEVLSAASRVKERERRRSWITKGDRFWVKIYILRRNQAWQGSLPTR